GEVALAIRLNEERAALWETNLANVFEMRTGARPAVGLGNSRSWQIALPSLAPRSSTLLLERSGDWTFLGLAPATNSLFSEFLARVQENQDPFNSSATNHWVEAELDLSRISSAFSLGWELPPQAPRISLTFSENEGRMRTVAQLKFTNELPFEFEAWQIPTNLIHDPLVSFTAVQGLKPWLTKSPHWQTLNSGDAPNQIFLWAMDGMPFLSYCAAPLKNASNVVAAISERLLTSGNAWLSTNEGIGRFELSTNGNRTVWRDLPLSSPYLEAAVDEGREFVTGGLVPVVMTGRPAPIELMKEILTRTNLFYYDWEITGLRIEQLLYSVQMFRLACHKAQVPASSVSVAWLRALEQKLGNCGTVVTRTSPNQLSLVRNSTIGLSAAELHLLVDWLESPDFPRGLNTFRAPPDFVPKRRSRSGNPDSAIAPPAPLPR
ncbi:MAG TPA: hypothetical protein VEC99_11650, partial [Clostridia bacterium]|nr:hypothetical protein [Clostridia bacterium]